MMPLSDAHRYVERLGYTLRLAGTKLGIEWSLTRKRDAIVVANGIEDSFRIAITRAIEKAIRLPKNWTPLVAQKPRV